MLAELRCMIYCSSNPLQHLMRHYSSLAPLSQKVMAVKLILEKTTPLEAICPPNMCLDCRQSNESTTATGGPLNFGVTERQKPWSQVVVIIVVSLIA